MSELKRALVEFNKDPDRLGRVRIRIPDIHGNSESQNYVATNDLPWSSPCIPWFIGNDCGSYNIPPVGTWVWVLEESNSNSELLSYVYLGGVMSDSRSTVTPFNDLDNQRIIYENDRPKLVNDNYSDMGICSNPTNDKDIIKDVTGLSSDDYYPHQRVIFKSPKGSTIMVDETDNNESLSIIDRVGQIFKFVSPVSKSHNKGNSTRRYTKSALSNNQIKSYDESYMIMKSGKVVTKSGNILPEWCSYFISRLKSLVVMKNDDTNNKVSQLMEHNHYRSECTNGNSTAYLDMDNSHIRLDVNGAYIDMVSDRIHIHVGSSDIVLDPAHILIQSPRIDENP